MVVISKRSNVIPVDFGEFTLEYRANDENIKQLKDLAQKLQERGQQLGEVDDDKAIDELHDVVKTAWTDLFDEAAFEKVYAFSDNTTTDVLYYLIETIKGIVTEFETRNSKDVLQKYLD